MTCVSDHCNDAMRAVKLNQEQNTFKLLQMFRNSSQVLILCGSSPKTAPFHIHSFNIVLINIQICVNPFAFCVRFAISYNILLPKSLWDDIQPISLRETIANKPEPTKEPIPEKKKKSPMMALCMDLGAAEYANSRPAKKRVTRHRCLLKVVYITVRTVSML